MNTLHKQKDMMTTIQKLAEQQLDEDWLHITQDQQNQPFEKADVTKLIKKARNRTLKAKLLLAINVFCSLAIMAIFYCSLSR